MAFPNREQGLLEGTADSRCRGDTGQDEACDICSSQGTEKAVLHKAHFTRASSWMAGEEEHLVYWMEAHMFITFTKTDKENVRGERKREKTRAAVTSSMGFDALLVQCRVEILDQ